MQKKQNKCRQVCKSPLSDVRNVEGRSEEHLLREDRKSKTKTNQNKKHMLPRLPRFESRFICSGKFEFWGSHFWRDSSERKVSFFKCGAEGRGTCCCYHPLQRACLHRPWLWCRRSLLIDTSCKTADAIVWKCDAFTVGGEKPLQGCY